MLIFFIIIVFYCYICLNYIWWKICLHYIWWKWVCWRMRLDSFGMYFNFALITTCFIYLKWYMCTFYFKFVHIFYCKFLIFELCFILQVWIVGMKWSILKWWLKVQNFGVKCLSFYYHPKMDVKLMYFTV